jgi:hypothetical protein
MAGIVEWVELIHGKDGKGCSEGGRFASQGLEERRFPVDRAITANGGNFSRRHQM